MAAHKLVVVEHFGMTVDIPVDQVLVGRLVVPAVKTLYVVAALFAWKWSWQDCHCSHSQAFHSWDRNSCEQGQEFRNVCKHV